MRRGAIALVVAALGAGLGCPPPARYTEVQPGLSCDRATRVAYRTMVALGYTVTDVTVASPERAGGVVGTKTAPDGTTRTGRVAITCDARGAVLRPIEESLVPDFEFSRGFGYSFKELVKHPDVEEPWKASGLEVQLHVITPQEAVLDLGGIPTAGGTIPVRTTIRNNTARAVAFDPSRLELVATGSGEAAAPLAGRALDAAVAPGAPGDKLRGELLRARRVPPHTTAGGYLVFPAGSYAEARITIEDVETGEGEGFVVPVQ
jgi:hypothetical protein